MKKEIRKEQIELFRAAFRGREDTYRASKRVNEPVTDQVVKDHLVGKRRISQYLLSPDILNGEGTHWIVADVDTKPCQEAGVESLDVAIDIVESLAKLGVNAYIERSKGDGHHAMVFFSEPVLARKACALMLQAIDEVERDTGFRVKEVFPIQDNLSSVEYRSCLNLPLYGGDARKGRTVFLNPDDGYKPYKDQWEFLKSIEKVRPDKIDELVESGGIKLGDSPGSSDDDAEEEDNTGYEDMMPCVARMMKGVSEGQRDVVAFVLAIHFRVEKNLPEEITLALMLMWNRRNDPPLPDETIREKVKKAYHGGRGGRGYKGFKCEDELIRQFCDSGCPIREKKEDPARKQYFIGKAFVPKKLADELMAEHSFLYSGEQLYVYRDGVYVPTGEILVRRKCREKLGDEARIYRVKEVLAHIVDLTFTKTDRLNNHGHLINLKNGMLDWHKEELLPHDEEYLCTIQVPLIYNPNSECPVVDYFFRTTLFQDCIKLMEELFGYILVPDTSMHKSFMLTGQGANGKSTCLNLLESFAGTQNTSKIPLQDLDSHRFKRADLFGKLLNIFADLDSRDLESSSYFKCISGGDLLDAERKHKDPFYFRPFARLVYSANEVPKSPDRSFAFYRRWCIIPFPHTFVDNADRMLINKLTEPEELSGLLNRALSGLKRLFSQGHFTESTTVRKALEAYKRENDPIDAFVSDRCDFSDPKAKTERVNMYAVFSRYCKGEGLNRVSRNQFYSRIRTLPGVVGEVKGNQGKSYFVGIKLKPSQPRP